MLSEEELERAYYEEGYIEALEECERFEAVYRSLKESRDEKGPDAYKTRKAKFFRLCMTEQYAHYLGVIRNLENYPDELHSIKNKMAHWRALDFEGSAEARERLCSWALDSFPAKGGSVNAKRFSEALTISPSIATDPKTAKRIAMGQQIPTVKAALGLYRHLGKQAYHDLVYGGGSFDRDRELDPRPGLLHEIDQLIAEMDVDDLEHMYKTARALAALKKTIPF